MRMWFLRHSSVVQTRWIRRFGRSFRRATIDWFSEWESPGRRVHHTVRPSGTLAVTRRAGARTAGRARTGRRWGARIDGRRCRTTADDAVADRRTGVAGRRRIAGNRARYWRPRTTTANSRRSSNRSRSPPPPSTPTSPQNSARRWCRRSVASTATTAAGVVRLGTGAAIWTRSESLSDGTRTAAGCRPSWDATARCTRAAACWTRCTRGRTPARSWSCTAASSRRRRTRRLSTGSAWPSPRFCGPRPARAVSSGYRRRAGRRSKPPFVWSETHAERRLMSSFPSS